MIASHLQTIAMSQLNISFKETVNAVSTLSCLQINIRSLCVLTYCLPEYLTLIVGKVYAVNMAACILTLQIGVTTVLCGR